MAEILRFVEVDTSTVLWDLLNDTVRIYEWIPASPSMKETNLKIDPLGIDYSYIGGLSRANVIETMRMYVTGNTQAEVRNNLNSFIDVVNTIRSRAFDNDLYRTSALTFFLEWQDDGDAESKYASLYDIRVDNIGTYRTDTRISGYNVYPEGNTLGAIEITLALERSDWYYDETTPVPTVEVMDSSSGDPTTQLEMFPIIHNGDSRRTQATVWIDYDSVPFATYTNLLAANMDKDTTTSFHKDNGDMWYIGSNIQFTAISFWTSDSHIGRKDDFPAVTNVEFFNGATWVAMTSGAYDHNVDDNVTSNLLHYRWNDVPTSWTTTTINSQGPFYYVRLTFTGTPTYTTIDMAKMVLAGGNNTFQIDNTGKASLPTAININARVIGNHNINRIIGSIHTKSVYFTPFLCRYSLNSLNSTWMRPSEGTYTTFVRRGINLENIAIAYAAPGTNYGRAFAENVVSFETTDQTIMDAYVGTYKVFLRLECVGSAADYDALAFFVNLTTYGFDTGVLATTESAITREPDGTTGIIECLELGILTIPSGLNGLKLDLMSYTPYSAGTSHTVYIADIVLMPIDEGYFDVTSSLMANISGTSNLYIRSMSMNNRYANASMAIDDTGGNYPVDTVPLHVYLKDNMYLSKATTYRVNTLQLTYVDAVYGMFTPQTGYYVSDPRLPLELVSIQMWNRDAI